MSFEELLIKYEKMQSEHRIAEQKISSLESENSLLKQEKSSLEQENTNLKEKVENQQLQINVLNRYLFGSKREATQKTDENIIVGTQCSIFGVPEDEEIKKQVEEQTEKITVYRKKKNTKNPAGIKKSELKNIETVTEEYVLNPDKDKCPACSSELKQIGKEVVRQEIEYVPAKLKLKNYVQYVYKCTNCGTEKSEKETATIVKAKVPSSLLTHSFISSSLATEVIYQKYYMGVPLYRQEKVWDDRGLVLPRSMMANWCIKLCEYYLEPLYALMLNKLKKNSELLHADETTMQCNKEQGKNASSNSYMWVIASGELEKSKGVIFHYSKSRSSDVANNLLNDFNGILVTDGYDGYNILDTKLTHAECWAHARRYFYESVPLDSNKQMITTSDGYTGVAYIDDLFAVEKEISTLDVDAKLKIRKEKSLPIVEKFYEWVYSVMENKYITNSKLKKALVYAKNQKENLSKFLEDGRIPLTNSRAERAIRPFAVHRKNWLFADTTNGARANAILYSFIESAKCNNLNIYKYIKYLLDELSQLEGEQSESSIEKYLPWSKELPNDISNYDGEYKELAIAE